MQIIRLKEITIYLENPKEDINTIIRIIENNYSFFSFLFSNRIVIYHKSMIDIIKEELIEFRSGLEEENQKEILKLVYYSYLIKHYDREGYFKDENLPVFPEMNDNLLMCNVGAIYYQDINQYLEYIMNPTEEESNNIKNWMKEEVREEVYQILLKKYHLTLKQNDSNLPLIYSIYEEVRNNRIPITKNYTREKENISEIEELTKQFLKEIDPNYLKKYEEIKDQIIILNNNRDSKKYSYVDNNRIHLHRDGTIYDYIVLVHEFFHIVSNEREDSLFLKEFLSIYYEREAIHFLEKNGYSSLLCYDLKMIRENCIQTMIEKINPIIHHICMNDMEYEVSLSDIEREIVQEFYQYTSENELNERHEKYMLEHINFQIKAKERIDKEMITMIKNGPLLIYSLSYIISFYFVEELENNPNKDEIMNTILNDKKQLTVQELFEIIKEKNVKILR